jgi:hypothetical protein
VLVDYDHDGTPDLVAGFNDGLYYFKGSASYYTIEGGVKKIRHISFAPEKQEVFRRSYNIAPAVGDLNNDGMTELMYGINWGTLHVWMNEAGKSTIGEGAYMELALQNPPKEKFVRDLNGAHVTVADFDGDGTPDMVLGGNAGRELVSALGISPDSWAGNLALIEEELYKGHEKDLGKVLEADNQKGLKRYRELGGELLTVGSDGHRPQEVGGYFEQIAEILKSCGFRYYTVYKERKPEFLLI